MLRAPGGHAVAYHEGCLGIDELILELLNKRATHCVDNEFLCEVCKGTPRSGECGQRSIMRSGSRSVTSCKQAIN